MWLTCSMATHGSLNSEHLSLDNYNPFASGRALTNTTAELLSCVRLFHTRGIVLNVINIFVTKFRHILSSIMHHLAIVTRDRDFISSLDHIVQNYFV